MPELHQHHQCTTLLHVGGLFLQAVMKSEMGKYSRLRVAFKAGVVRYLVTDQVQ